MSKKKKNQEISLISVGIQTFGRLGELNFYLPRSKFSRFGFS